MNFIERLLRRQERADTIRLIEHYACKISDVEGKSYRESKYLAICTFVESIRELPRATVILDLLEDLLQREYQDLAEDIHEYLLVTEDKLILDPKENKAFLQRLGNKNQRIMGEDIIKNISNKWIFFAHDKLVFKEELTLANKIKIFAIPIKNSLLGLPVDVIWDCIYKGIVLAGKEPEQAVWEAREELSLHVAEESMEWLHQQITKDKK